MSIFLGDIWGKMLICSVLLTCKRGTHRKFHIELRHVFLFASSQRAAAFNNRARERTGMCAGLHESEPRDKKKTIKKIRY